jgi:hypothetical protein
MAGFKARKLKKGLFEVLGLEAYIEKKFAELKKALTFASMSAKTRPVATKASAPKPAAKVMAKGEGPLGLLVAALNKHPRRAELVKAGREKDQLLRSLVPLYVARQLNIEISSGLISRFWKMHGVSYAAPNAAKALREHVGYAKETKTGRQITPNGVKYVEHALQRRAA